MNESWANKSSLHHFKVKPTGTKSFFKVFANRNNQGIPSNGHQTLGTHHQPRPSLPRTSLRRVLPLSPGFPLPFWVPPNTTIYSLLQISPRTTKTLSSLLAFDSACYMSQRLCVPHSSSIAFRLHSHLLVSSEMNRASFWS